MTSRRSTKAEAGTEPDARDFLAALFPGSALIDLRALPSRVQEFIERDNTVALADFLARNLHENCYVGVAARLTPGDGSLTNCGALGALFVDLDFKAMPEAEARERLASFDLPPSIVVHSGGGLHLYWLLREPVNLQTDAPRAKALLRRLARHLGGDLQSAEPARILRLPGTFNYKYDPARPVTIERMDSTRRYDLTEFEDRLAQEPEVTSGQGTFALPERIREGERNATLYKLARGMKVKNASPETILAALRAENQVRCVPPLSEAEVENIAAHAAQQADSAEFRVHPGANNPWAAAQSASDFVNADEPDPEFLERNLLVRGSITEMFSPRGIGKTHVGYAMGVQLARQGYRVLLLDRDNSRKEVRRRLRAWGVTDGLPLKVMTRNEVPPLTDTAAWEKFPASEYDLVILDSLDATAEGIGEKDSAKPSRAIAPLLDLAHRENGPAILVLGNTVRTAAHSRGSGVIEDRADIVFEVRDATDFTPTGKKPWWLELPPASAADWGERAARRKRRTTYRLAFIPSKFRVGQEPDPLMLELGLPDGAPWTMQDVTEEVTHVGEDARKKAEADQAQRSNEMAEALKAEIIRRKGTQEPPMTTGAAVEFLVGRGMGRNEVVALVKERERRDWWFQELKDRPGRPKVLQPITFSSAQQAKEAMLAERQSKDLPGETFPPETPQGEKEKSEGISPTRMSTGREKPDDEIAASSAEIREGGLFLPPASDTSEEPQDGPPEPIPQPVTPPIQRTPVPIKKEPVGEAPIKRTPVILRPDGTWGIAE